MSKSKNWSNDTTRISEKKGTLYLSMIRDLFDNSIIAYRTGTEQSIRLVLETIRQARKKEAVAAELQLHSDQGFQYTSIAFYSIWRFRFTQSGRHFPFCLDGSGFAVVRYRHRGKVIPCPAGEAGIVWRFRLYTKLSALPRVHLAADAPIPRFH